MMIKSIRKLHALISRNVSNKVTVRGVKKFKRIKTEPEEFIFEGDIVRVTAMRDHAFTVFIDANGILGSIRFHSERHSSHIPGGCILTGFEMEGASDIVTSPINAFVDTVTYASVYKHPSLCYDMRNNTIDDILDDVYRASILPHEIPRNKYQMLRISENMVACCI